MHRRQTLEQEAPRQHGKNMPENESAPQTTLFKHQDKVIAKRTNKRSETDLPGSSAERKALQIKGLKEGIEH
jgi:hypothetical protein